MNIKLLKNIVTDTARPAKIVNSTANGRQCVLFNSLIYCFIGYQALQVSVIDSRYILKLLAMTAQTYLSDWNHPRRDGDRSQPDCSTDQQYPTVSWPDYRPGDMILKQILFKTPYLAKLLTRGLIAPSQGYYHSVQLKIYNQCSRTLPQNSWNHRKKR